MTVNSADILTLPEMLRRGDFKGMKRKMVNPLIKASPAAADGLWVPSNNPLHHETTVVTALPGVTLGRLGDAYVGTSGKTANRVDGLSRIMALSTIPLDKLRAAGDPAQRRMQETALFFPAMSQTADYYIFQGDNDASDKQFDGFLKRRNVLSDFCLSAGGTTNLTSIILANWNQDGCFLTHPENLPAGLDHKDHGEQLWPVSTELGGGDIEACKETFDWWLGLSVPMDSDLIRLANVDSVDLFSQVSTQALTAATNIQRQMAQMMTRCVGLLDTAKFYVSRKIHAAFLDMAIQRALGNTFSFEVLNNRPMLRYMGIEIRISDNLTYGEAQVVA